MHYSDKQRVLLEKFPPSLLVITRSEIKYCGKITDSFFCLCLLMLFSCTWWLTIKDSLDKCNTSLGIVFQMGNNSVNLILPLQITRNYDDQNSFRSLPIVCV